MTVFSRRVTGEGDGRMSGSDPEKIEEGFTGWDQGNI